MLGHRSRTASANRRAANIRVGKQRELMFGQAVQFSSYGEPSSSAAMKDALGQTEGWEQHKIHSGQIQNLLAKPVCKRRFRQRHSGKPVSL